MGPKMDFLAERSYLRQLYLQSLKEQQAQQPGEPTSSAGGSIPEGYAEGVDQLKSCFAGTDPNFDILFEEGADVHEECKKYAGYLFGELAGEDGKITVDDLSDNFSSELELVRGGGGAAKTKFDILDFNNDKSLSEEELATVLYSMTLQLDKDIGRNSLVIQSLTASFNIGDYSAEDLEYTQTSSISGMSTAEASDEVNYWKGLSALDDNLYWKYIDHPTQNDSDELRSILNDLHGDLYPGTEQQSQGED